MRIIENYLLLLFLLLSNFYQLSVKSNNLKEIFKQEQLENNIKKRQQKIINEKEQVKCKNLLEQSNYYQVLKPYDNSGKTNSGYNYEFSKNYRVYINPNNNKILLVDIMDNSSNLCKDFVFTKYNGITLGFLNKRITTKCFVDKNSDEKYQYIVEVNKEMIYDYYSRKRKEFLVRYHKKGNCIGQWSNVYSTLIGIEPYKFGIFSVR